MNLRTIGLVDDDPKMLQALDRLLVANGFHPRRFSSAEDFLARHRTEPCDCVILDLRMPGIDGLELLERLRKLEIPIPVIFLSGEGDIPASVRAIKGGAVDFLTKPVDATDLMNALRLALHEAAKVRANREAADQLRGRFATLTPRETEVLRHVITGKLNKQIAADLGISEQTVKIHRMRLVEKTGLPSVAELVRAADHLGIEPAA